MVTLVSGYKSDQLTIADKIKAFNNFLQKEEYMHFLTDSPYPIGQQILIKLRESKLKVSEFIQAIGYKNINKGVRSFNLFISEGRGPTIFISRLQQSNFALPAHVLEEALSATKAIHREKEQKEITEEVNKRRAAFQPYFMPRSNKRPPMSITVFALLGGYELYRHLLPPDIKQMKESERMHLISYKIKADYDYRIACSKDLEETNQDGPCADIKSVLRNKIPLASDIESYLVYLDFDEPPYVFNISGELIGRENNSSLPHIYAKTRSKELPAWLFGG